MARLSFSKAALHKQGALLKRYRHYLPSLDLKRQQLMVEKAKAVKQLQTTQSLIQQQELFVFDNLPMLADNSIELEHLINVKQIAIEQENVVGVDLPSLKSVYFEEQHYSFFCKPHWVDMAVLKLKQMLELKIRLQVEQQRLDLLNKAVKKVTQRVNLFDKVLIPGAEQNIRKIRIFLSDTERAAVVRAKITKQKRIRDGNR